MTRCRAIVSVCCVVQSNCWRLTSLSAWIIVHFDIIHCIRRVWTISYILRESTTCSETVVITDIQKQFKLLSVQCIEMTKFRVSWTEENNWVSRPTGERWIKSSCCGSSRELLYFRHNTETGEGPHWRNSMRTVQKRTAENIMVGQGSSVHRIGTTYDSNLQHTHTLV